MRAKLGFGKFFSLAACGVLLLAGAAFATENGDTQGNESASDAPRAVIKFADHGGINDWRATDRKTLYVEGRHHQWFKATFFGPCSGLRFTDAIGFVTEANGDLDHFSSVLVNDRRCAFRTFERVDGPPKKDVAKMDSDKQDSDAKEQTEE